MSRVRRVILAVLLLAAVLGPDAAVAAESPPTDGTTDVSAAEAPTTTVPPTTVPTTTVPPTTVPTTTVPPTTVPTTSVPPTTVAEPPPLPAAEPPPSSSSSPTRRAEATVVVVSNVIPLKAAHAGVSTTDPEWPHNGTQCNGVVVPDGQVRYQFVGSSIDGATSAGTLLNSATWSLSQAPSSMSGGSIRWLVTTPFTSTPLDMAFTTDGTPSRQSELRVGFSCSGAVATTGALSIAKAVDGFGVPASPGPFTIHYTNGAGVSGDVSVAAGGSQTVSGLATGAYTISEPSAPGSVQVSFSPSATVAVTAGATTAVTVTNTYQDIVDPLATLTTPPHGATYVRGQAVTADFSCGDESGGAGLASCVGTGLDGSPVGTSVLGSHDFTVTATDNAGNTSSVTHTYTVVDVTDPTIDLRTPPDGATYGQGQAVTADFSCGDETGGSGVASCVGTVDDGSAVGTSTLGSHDFTVTATDNAGNTFSVTHTYTVVDVTDPTVDLRTPIDGAVYGRFELVVADFDCADEAGGSGLGSCVGTVDDGSTVDTSVLGAHDFTVTATDVAGNAASVTHGYTVVDVTDPTIDLRTPPHDAVYDRDEAVDADFDCADEAGGSSVVSCVGTVDDGSAVATSTLGSHDFTVTATDNGGNTSSVTHTYTVVDVTDPTVDLRTPPDGATYDRDEAVDADFSCGDETGGSGVASCVGTVDDGSAAGTSTLGSHDFTVTATDQAGNTASVTHSYTVVDVTDPTIDLRTPPDGATFERFSLVAADFDCADETGGSGLGSCVGTVDDGSAAGTSTLGPHDFTVTATDNAGNTSSVTHTYTVVDVTDPTIDLRTPPDGATFERFSLVAADFDCADETGGSGVASCVGTVDDGSLVGTSTLGSHDFTVTATDNAGNTSSVTHTYTVVDVTGPTVVVTTPAEGAVYEQGEVLAADFSCEDEPGGSGLDACLVQSAGGNPLGGVEGARAEVVGGPVDTSSPGPKTMTVIATDRAGNTTMRTQSYEVADTTAPAVEITTPADGASFVMGQVARADFACVDGAGSGIASCEGTVPFGEPIDTSAPGPAPFTVTGTDSAGNSTTVTHTYTVLEGAPPPPTPPGDAVTVASPTRTPQTPSAPPAPPRDREPDPDDGVCVTGLPETSVQRGSPLTFTGPGALTDDHQVWVDGEPAAMSIDGSSLLVVTDRLQPGRHQVTAACRGEVIMERSFSVFLAVGSAGAAGGLGAFFGIFIVFLSSGFLWRAGGLALAGLLSMRSRPDRLAGAAAAVLLLLALLAAPFLSTGVASAAEDGAVRIRTTINERAVEGATANDPIRLVPDEPTTIGLTVRNEGATDLRIERVRMSGTSLGLTLIAYDIPVPLDVAAGDEQEVEIPLVLFDLDRQATGLVPGTVSVYDDRGEVVARESFTFDIRGSVTSVTGLFGLVILIATLLSVVIIARHIASRTLPSSRFRRGLRFGLTGVGIGLTFVIALAGLRVAAAEGTIWVPFALVPGLLGFALGFISPGVLKIEEDEVDLARGDLLRLTQDERPMAAASAPD